MSTEISNEFHLNSEPIQEGVEHGPYLITHGSNAIEYISESSHGVAKNYDSSSARAQVSQIQAAILSALKAYREGQITKESFIRLRAGAIAAILGKTF